MDDELKNKLLDIIQDTISEHIGTNYYITYIEITEKHPSDDLYMDMNLDIDLKSPHNPFEEEDR